MSVVLAAIDDTEAATAVLAHALALAEMLGATTRAIHADGGAGATAARARAAAVEVPLEVREGPSEQVVGDALRDPEVVMGVMAARQTPEGARPAGHVTVDVIQHAAKPVLVVPPQAAPAASPARPRVLVPLDGTDLASDGVRDLLALLTSRQAELIVVHVFDVRTVPPFWDQPTHAQRAWAAEFEARHCAPPAVTSLVLRQGEAGEEILRLLHDVGGDLVALSWAQDLSRDRAAVVRELVTRAHVPVLLVPRTRPGDGRAERAG